MDTETWVQMGRTVRNFQTWEWAWENPDPVEGRMKERKEERKKEIGSHIVNNIARSTQTPLSAGTNSMV
jgi:hypothetical protein